MNEFNDKKIIDALLTGCKYTPVGLDEFIDDNDVDDELIQRLSSIINSLDIDGLIAIDGSTQMILLTSNQQYWLYMSESDKLHRIADNKVILEEQVI